MDSRLFGSIIVDPSISYDVSVPPIQLARNWDAAETDRLNEAHWKPVTENINDSMLIDLQILQARCRHESINNSVIDSGIETQCTNVVGATGPELDVLTDDDRFNEDVEALFEAWAAECEYQDNLSLVELLEGWTAQWAFNGEMLIQEIVGKKVSDYRLHDLGAEAFDNTLQSQQIFGGIELDDQQHVAFYHVCDPETRMQKRKLRKEFTLHCYHRRFSMQRRGFPTLGSSLPTAADLRDYDDQVMDAARAAADYSIVMYTDHPDANLVTPAQKVIPIRRRMRHYAAPGWKPMELKGNQPTVTYDAYRKQRHTDIGGSLGEMPLMILRRDASNHNMSSARFDGSRYAKAVDRFQARMARRILNPIVRRLVRIAQLTGLLRPTPLDRRRRKFRDEFPNYALPIHWTWPKPPPIDAVKDAMAQRIRLENGTISFSQAVTEDGNKPADVIRMRSKDNASLVAAGLPPIVGPLPSTDPAMLAMVLQDDDDDLPEQADPSGETESDAPLITSE